MAPSNFPSKKIPSSNIMHYYKHPLNASQHGSRMTAITTPPVATNFPSTLPQPRAKKRLFPETSPPAFCWMGGKCRRFSLVTSETLNLALNIIILVGRLSTTVPAGITKGALTGLSFSGLVGLPYSIALTKKTMKDAALNYAAHNYATSALSAARAVEEISNVGMILTGSAASVAGMLGRNALQFAVYRVMTPWGMATLLLMITTKVAYIMLNRHVLQQFKGSLLDRHAMEVVEAFRAKKTAIIDRPLAAQVHACMNKTTLAELLKIKKLPAVDHAAAIEKMKIAISSIQEQQNSNLSSELALIALGWIAMGIQKYYTPNSVVYPLLNLGMSAAYKIKQHIDARNTCRNCEAMNRRSR